MNVTFRLATERARSAVHRPIDGRGARRPEGPPGGRRHAGVDLQRVSRSGVDALVDFMKEFERRHGLRREPAIRMPVFHTVCAETPIRATIHAFVGHRPPQVTGHPNSRVFGG